MSQKKPYLFQMLRPVHIYLIITFIAFPLSDCTADSPSKSDSAATAASQQQGIQVESIRLSGAGHFIDFRYRVLDPEKAAALLDRSQKAVLIDQASQTELPVPITKLGPIRQTTRKPEKDRVYFMLFTNAGNLVKSGSRVNLRIGDFEAQDIVVQ